jgi:hypothetical protein
MFHQRPSAFSPDLSAIEGRLRALENEINRVGRKAGRRASAGLSAAGDQLGDAVASAVNEIVERFRSGRRITSDEAMRLGSDAARFGTRIGNDALHRLTDEVEHRPLTMLAFAIGIGILIGIAGSAGRH